MPETFPFEYESIDGGLAFAVLQSDFEDGSEQTRLRHPHMDGVFQVKSPALTDSQATPWQDFFEARKGAFEPFYIIVAHMLDDQSNPRTFYVRFVSGTWSNVKSGGIARITFDCKVVHNAP